MGVDVRTGDDVWELPGADLIVADVCRDLVVVAERGTAAPFRVLDQHTGENDGAATTSSTTARML